MCKYCGNRIEEGRAFNGRGARVPNGDYCTPECGDAVHGFDMKLIRERGGKTISFNPAKHDRACPQTIPPDKAMMAAEEAAEEASTRRAAVRSESDIMDAAEEIDPRLPGILAGIKKGRTQEEMARRLGVDPATITRAIAKLRATLSGA